MKSSLFLLLAVVGVLFFGTGCGHIQVEQEGDVNRVLKGTVNAGGVLPEGTEIVVRLVTTEMPMAAPSPASDAGLAPRAAAPSNATERVLGESRQTLAKGTIAPVPFTLQYEADDSLLRRGVNVDVRISVGGKLRYRTILAHVVTLASSPYPQVVAVQAAQ